MGQQQQQKQTQFQMTPVNSMMQRSAQSSNSGIEHRSNSPGGSIGSYGSSGRAHGSCGSSGSSVDRPATPRAGTLERIGLQDEAVSQGSNSSRHEVKSEQQRELLANLARGLAADNWQLHRELAETKEEITRLKQILAATGHGSDEQQLMKQVSDPGEVWQERTAGDSDPLLDTVLDASEAREAPCD